eukprot:TRINITY_DN11908_c0_g2_i1.p4 TRINITY_DN11908_c0_g2~~TRINITY_DN11908_c0_g2_i1.p4  ORF type:complete len:104 (+),score=4.96 TRINITY_DN11908_c0_g2_i1:1572-1883(+)
MGTQQLAAKFKMLFECVPSPPIVTITLAMRAENFSMWNYNQPSSHIICRDFNTGAISATTGAANTVMCGSKMEAIFPTGCSRPQQLCAIHVPRQETYPCCRMS